MMGLRCEILTLFPELIAGVIGQSMLKRARDRERLCVGIRNIRDYAEGRHQVADDAPYGGGGGMVLKAEPILRAVQAVRQEAGEVRVILPSPQGIPFCQARAEDLAQERRLIVFICGHYEGIDERVRLSLDLEEVSVGDYVLTGGELPALMMLDAAARLVPGVLGDETSARQDSFCGSLLDWPHYTRPWEVNGLMVPEVLRSGDHEAIQSWRRRAALKNTYEKRPDLLRPRELSGQEMLWLQEIAEEYERTRDTPGRQLRSGVGGGK